LWFGAYGSRGGIKGEKRKSVELEVVADKATDA